MVSPWMVYLISAAGALRSFGVFLIAFALISLFVALLIYMSHENEKSERESDSAGESVWDRYPNLKKSIYIAGIVLLVGLTLVTAIPSKREAAAILATKIALEQKAPLDEVPVLKERILQVINGAEND